MRKRLDSRVLCLLMVVVCLGTGARDSAAQQGNLSKREAQRDLVKDCGFLDGGLSGCLTMARQAWLTFKGGVLGAVLPDRRLVVDGTFVRPNAPDFYELRAWVEGQPAGAGICAGPDRPARDQFIRMTCNARRQLLPFGRNRWEKENERFRQFRQQLVAAGCLPAEPQDTCELIGKTVADAVSLVASSALPD